MTRSPLLACCPRNNEVLDADRNCVDIPGLLSRSRNRKSYTSSQHGNTISKKRCERMVQRASGKMQKLIIGSHML